MVANPRPLHSHLAEGRLEGVRACPPPLDASAPLAVPLLKNQFFVGLLDQDLVQLTLDLETGLMDVGLDLVGETFVLGRYGQGHLQQQIQRECLTVTVDGVERDGSLKAVGCAHGVSPYWYSGGASCVLFDRSAGKSHYPGAESRRKTLRLYRASRLLSRTNWRALGKFRCT
jgi:hypothetical protein